MILLPTYLVKHHVDRLPPQITRIANKSLETGCVPDELKHANILTLIKKDNLDKDILKTYRPVSNLTFVSKLLLKDLKIIWISIICRQLCNLVIALFALQRQIYSECKMT